MSEKHDLFISYACDENQEKVKELHNVLKGDYKICFDEWKINEDNLLDKMQKVITDSKIVICCLTKEYENGQNTRLELDFAYSIEKPILFLKVEEDVEGKSYSEMILKDYRKLRMYVLPYKMNDVDLIKKEINEIISEPVRNEL